MVWLMAMRWCGYFVNLIFDVHFIRLWVSTFAQCPGLSYRIVHIPNNEHLFIQYLLNQVETLIILRRLFGKADVHCTCIPHHTIYLGHMEILKHALTVMASKYRSWIWTFSEENKTQREMNDKETWLFMRDKIECFLFALNCNSESSVNLS